jgi:hypothetical protein
MDPPSLDRDETALVMKAFKNREWTRMNANNFPFDSAPIPRLSAVA